MKYRVNFRLVILMVLLAGFAVPNLAALAWLAGNGSLTAYIDQVWRWPAQYAASPIVALEYVVGVPKQGISG